MLVRRTYSIDFNEEMNEICWKTNSQKKEQLRNNTSVYTLYETLLLFEKCEKKRYMFILFDSNIIRSPFGMSFVKFCYR